MAFPRILQRTDILNLFKQRSVRGAGTSHNMMVFKLDWQTIISELDWFRLVYGIPTLVGHLMPNPLYTYILNIYDFVWLVFMAYQPL